MQQFCDVYIKRLKNKQPSFSLNSNVTWTSHSPKGSKTKTGTIVAIIEPFQEVTTVFNEWHKYQLSPQYGTPRAMRSYLVSCKEMGSLNKPKLYWPFSNGLKEIK